MSIFSRMSDIVNSNLNSLLDRAENPQKIVRLVIQEMEDTLVEVRTVAARTIAEQKTLHRRMSAAEAEGEDWRKKAELALRKEREDLAAAALKEAKEIDTQIVVMKEESSALAAELEQMDVDIRKLEEKLSEAKAREQSLAQRQRSVTQRLRIRGQIHDRRLEAAIGRFERYEQRLDQLEGRADSYGIGQGPSLRNELASLEAEQEVKKDLEALKERLRTEARAEFKDSEQD